MKNTKRVEAFREFVDVNGLLPSDIIPSFDTPYSRSERGFKNRKQIMGIYGLDGDDDDRGVVNRKYNNSTYEYDEITAFDMFYDWAMRRGFITDGAGITQLTRAGYMA